jgi:hypothetical protein
MNLFHCKLYPWGFGDWQGKEHQAVTRLGVEPYAWVVYESQDGTLPDSFYEPPIERATGWFASEAESLYDCEFVRQLADDEYCKQSGYVMGNCSLKYIVVRKQGLTETPYYLKQGEETAAYWEKSGNRPQAEAYRRWVASLSAS